MLRLIRRLAAADEATGFNCVGMIDCGVAVTNIPLGALEVRGGRGFFQRIFRIDRSILNFSAFGTPAAAGQVVRQRPIRGGSVSAGLAARNDPGNLFHHCVENDRGSKIVSSLLRLQPANTMLLDSSKHFTSATSAGIQKRNWVYRDSMPQLTP